MVQNQRHTYLLYRGGVMIESSSGELEKVTLLDFDSLCLAAC